MLALCSSFAACCCYLTSCFGPPSYLFPVVHRSLVWLCTLDTSSFPVFWMDCLFQEFSAAFSGRYSAVGMLASDSVRDVGCPYLLHTLPCFWLLRVSAKFLFLHLLASAVPCTSVELLNVPHSSLLSVWVLGSLVHTLSVLDTETKARFCLPIQRPGKLKLFSPLLC